MKNYVLLLVCMLSAIAASAQYCSIQKGQKLYYEVLTGKKKTETYTSVVNVECIFRSIPVHIPVAYKA